RQHRLREANGQALEQLRLTGGEVADGGPARERHRAETVDDDAGKADRLGELLVEVDRHLVAGRSRVPVRLVEVEGLLRYRDGIGAPKLLREAVLGRSLALALAPGDAAKERHRVLLVDELARLVARLHAADDRGARLLHVDADRRRTRPQNSPGDDRLMEVHVLLAVDDERERVSRRHLAYGAAHRVPHRHDGEDRRRELTVRVRRDRVVGGGGVLLDPLRIDLEVLLVRPLPDLVDGELHQYSSGSPAPPRGSLPSPSRWPSVSTFVRAVG